MSTISENSQPTRLNLATLIDLKKIPPTEVTRILDKYYGCSSISLIERESLLHSLDEHMLEINGTPYSMLELLIDLAEDPTEKKSTRLNQDELHNISAYLEHDSEKLTRCFDVNAISQLCTDFKLQNPQEIIKLLMDNKLLDKSGHLTTLAIGNITEIQSLQAALKKILGKSANSFIDKLSRLTTNYNLPSVTTQILTQRIIDIADSDIWNQLNEIGSDSNKREIFLAGIRTDAEIPGLRVSPIGSSMLGLTIFPPTDPEYRYIPPNGHFLDPRDGGTRRHKGIDLSHPTIVNLNAAKIYPNINAIQSGKVEFVGELTGYGKTLIIRHPDGSRSLYAHLSSYNHMYISKKVQGGDIIALMGNTGNAGNYTHLHFEIWKPSNKSWQSLIEDIKIRYNPILFYPNL